MISDTDIDLAINPMDWMDATAPVIERDKDNLNVVGGAARLAVFNHVRCAFEIEAKRGKIDRKRLAQALGVSQSLIGRWLREPSNMTIETAAKLLFGMGREFRLASPQSERHDGITMPKVHWIQMAPSHTAPTFSVSVNSENATVRSTGEPCDLEVSVFDGCEGMEAWITGAGIKGAYLKAVPSHQDNDIQRVNAISYVRSRRENHAHA